MADSTNLSNGTMQSPGSRVVIQDYSDYSVSQSTCVIGIVGAARKGPLTPTLVTTVSQFIKTYGAPDGETYGPYGAIYYLQQGNQVYYQRVVHDGSPASAGIPGTDKFIITALQVGSEMNGIQVKFEVSDEDQSVNVSVLSNDQKTLETFEGLSTDSSSVNFIPKKINGTSEYIKLELHSTGGITTKTFTLKGGVNGGKDATGGNDTIQFVTRTFDSTLNGAQIKLTAKDFTGYFDYTLIDQSGSTLETIATVSDDPDDDRYLPFLLNQYSKYINAEMTTKSEYKEQPAPAGYQVIDMTSAKNAPIKTDDTVAIKVSLKDDKKVLVAFPSKSYSTVDADDDTVSQLVADGFKWASLENVPVKGNESAYAAARLIREVEASAVTTEGTLSFDGDLDTLRTAIDDDTFVFTDISDTEVKPNISGQIYDLKGGLDGNENIESSDYIGNELKATGVYAFSNPDVYSIDLLTVPGVTDAAVISAAINMVTSRGDTFFIADVPFGLQPQDAVDWTNGQATWVGKHATFDTSYAAFYAPWGQVRDGYTGKLLWLPPSVFVAPRYAYTDTVGGPWLAPAGADRGKIDGLLQLEYSPTLGERDLMYGNRNIINPVVNFGTTGILVNGQKTAQRKPTALDRINVRRLVNYVQRMLQQSARYFVFEPNDSATWQRWITVVEPKLDALKNSRAINNYKIQMDETTVSVDDRENGRMPGLVAIQPLKSAEFIPITLRIDNQSAVYNDDTSTSATGVSGYNDAASQFAEQQSSK